MSVPQTNIHGLDLNIGAREAEAGNIQEKLNYAADRFQTMLGFMRKKSEAPSWFQKTLATELVCNTYFLYSVILLNMSSHMC
jgi:hypothetical protein